MSAKVSSGDAIFISLEQRGEWSPAILTERVGAPRYRYDDGERQQRGQQADTLLRATTTDATNLSQPAGCHSASMTPSREKILEYFQQHSTGSATSGAYLDAPQGADRVEECDSSDDE